MSEQFRLIMKILRCLAVLLLVLCFSSCSKKSNETVVEFWTLQLSPAFNDYFHSVIREYERNHPGVKIRWIDIPYDSAIQKLMSSVAAGSPPDVVNLSADFLAKFAGMGALADIYKLIPPDSLKNIFLPNALNNCVFNGRLTAFPWYLNTYVVIYNRDLFAKAGFGDKDVPATYEQLLKFARTYKDRTGKYAFFWNIGKESYLPMMLGSEGVSMLDASLNHAAFNSAEGVHLIEQWVDLYRAGYIEKESIIKPASTTIEAYQSGQAAFVFTGPVFLRSVRENAPAVYANTGIAPAIVGRTGRHELAEMVLTIMNTSEHKKEAADFALFVTNEQNQLNFCRLATIYPSVTEALKDEYFTRDEGTLESKARIIGAAELPGAVPLRNHLLHPQFDMLRDSFDEAVQNACLGKQSPRDALNSAADEWNRIIQEY